jgi:hypothetical protein
MRHVHCNGEKGDCRGVKCHDTSSGKEFILVKRVELTGMGEEKNRLITQRVGNVS